MTTLKLTSTSDLEEIKLIHEKYYKEKFSFPNFLKFIRSFTIRNNTGRIVVAGGIRPILEVVAITDKAATNRDKYEGLYKLLWGVEETARNNKYDQIHCFPEHDSNWQRRLKKDGFRLTESPAFVKFIDPQEE